MQLGKRDDGPTPSAQTAVLRATTEVVRLRGTGWYPLPQLVSTTDLAVLARGSHAPHSRHWPLQTQITLVMCGVAV